MLIETTPLVKIKLTVAQNNSTVNFYANVEGLTQASAKDR